MRVCLCDAGCHCQDVSNAKIFANLDGRSRLDRVHPRSDWKILCTSRKQFCLMAGDDADMADELINLLRLISSHSSMRRIFLSRVEYKFSPPSPQRKRTRCKCLHCASYPTETFRSRRENTFDSQSNCLLMCRSNVFKIDLLSGEKRFRESIKRPRPDGLIANGKIQNHFDILRATLTTSCRMIDG